MTIDLKKTVQKIKAQLVQDKLVIRNEYEVDDFDYQTFWDEKTKQWNPDLWEATTYEHPPTDIPEGGEVVTFKEMEELACSECGYIVWNEEDLYGHQGTDPREDLDPRCENCAQGSPVLRKKYPDIEPVDPNARF